jgi:putative addiction module component (TIGR02574 family)
MSIAEIRQLPQKEKMRIMEAIWEDLRSRAEDVPVPQWHKDLLDSRDEAVRSGREAVLEGDAVKDPFWARR